MTNEHATTCAEVGQNECPECRQPFTPYNNRKNVIFCSYPCQVAYNVKRRREVRLAALKARNSACPWCGEAFMPSRSNQAFCSDSCRDRLKHSQRRGRVVASKQKVACGVCGAEFLPRSQSSKYCSRPCRQKAHADRARIRHQAKPEKQREYQAEYRKRNNESVRKHRLKNWYGITLEMYNEMLAAQQHRCAICGVSLSGGRDTHLDHDHGPSGKVRGILCSACNSGLGQFKDSPDVLERAKQYLLHHVNK